MKKKKTKGQKKKKKNCVTINSLGSISICSLQLIVLAATYVYPATSTTFIGTENL